MKIAVTGKGGVGKTTIAATLARLYADEGKTVYAADADPDANLGLALGFSEEELAEIIPVSKMRKLVEERTGADKSNTFYKINPKVDDIPERYSKFRNGVRLLILGTVETAGSGCVCPENVMLKRIINNLILHREDVVLLDMEAGLEHLGRGTTEGMDQFIVVIEPGARSIDGGKTWEKMRLPLAFGEYGGLPAAQNGVGDPSILVDTKTNTIWIVAAWTHGMGNQRAWWSSQQGMDVNHTAQLVLVKSTDDGKNWSEPINITEQVKHPEWYFLLQGPGRGITMEDGTLVFPIQYIGKDRIPNAGIMYSKDRGETWTIHNHARTNTTEAQVAEVVPGTLMLNMRDNRGGSRAVYTTSDLGMTWKEHESSRTALPEPVCMASLISVKAADNVLGKDILIFSNPNTTNARKNITIKISLDGGNTWAHQLLLDEGENWGYSCLTMVDKETIGILYESSVAHMTFQCIKLKDIVQ